MDVSFPVSTAEADGPTFGKCMVLSKAVQKKRKDMRLHRVQDQISQDCKACLAEWCGHVFGGPSMGCDLAPMGAHFGEAVQSCRQAP